MRRFTKTDLTEALKDAPHGAELLEKFPVVGGFALSIKCAGKQGRRGVLPGLAGPVL